jgi:hypothetical protein
MSYLRHLFLIPILLICFLYTAGCTGATHDEDYKTLVIEAIEKLDPQNEKIINPYKGMTIDDLSAMKTFAEQAKSSAEQMTLSDTYKKSREFFLRAMDATIAGVDSPQGDIDTATGKVESTAPATNYFIQVQSDLGSAADIIKVPKKKTY